MNKSHVIIKRMTYDGVMLALLCLVGMFSIPLGMNVKVSLQLLMIFIIALTAPSFIDCIAIPSLYLLMGLFMPIYAGFSMGITPTFGYIISFVVIAPLIYFVNKIPLKIAPLRMFIALLSGLMVCYFIGSLFMALYLHWDIRTTLLTSIVPYLPFDFAKIVIAILVIMIIPKSIYQKD